MNENFKKLAKLVLKYSNFRKVEDLIAALEGDKGSEALDVIDDNLRESDANQFTQGRDKISGMLRKGLESLGFKEKFEEPDKAFFDNFKKWLDTLKATEEGAEGGTGDKNVDKLKAKIKELETTIDKMTSDHQEALEKKESEVGQAILREKVYSIAREQLAALNAVLPSDETLAGKKMKRYLDEFKEFGFEADPKNPDTIYLLDAEGKRVRENNRLVTVADKLPEFAAIHYTLKEVDEKNPSGLDGKGKGDEGKGKFEFKNFTGAVPKTIDEFNKLIQDTKLAWEAKDELLAYEETNPFASADA